MDKAKPPEEAQMKVVNSDELKSWINQNEFELENPQPPQGLFRMIWPTNIDKVVTQWYGINPQWYPCCAGHEGIDIRAPNGTEIVAVYPGKVYLVEKDPNSGPYGIQVRVEHQASEGIFKTVYAHFMEAKVQVNDNVVAGQVLGLANNTGNSSGAHLHLTLKWVGHGSDWMDVNGIVNPVPYMPDLFPNGQWRLDVGGNFRTSPEVNNNLIRYLSANARVDCTGKFDDDWWEIIASGQRGWFWNPGYKMFPV